jgi:Flp pilus assembly protein TadB
MKKHGMWMWLLCLIPILLIAVLLAAGIRFDATWLFAIILLACCVLPMLMMRRRGKKSDQMNE